MEQLGKEEPIAPDSLFVWYRHCDDPDQSVRVGFQTASNVSGMDDAIRQIQRYRAAGYNVQRAEVASTCPVCSGEGSVYVKPKRMTAKKFASLPAWSKERSRCPAKCSGGSTRIEVIDLSAVEPEDDPGAEMTGDAYRPEEEEE